MAEEVSKLKWYLLTIKTFINWLIFIHGVSRQVCEIFEWISTLKQPLHFEIGHELQLVLVNCGSFGAMLLVGLILLEAFHFVVGVRFTLHSGNALEATRFIDGEDQDNVLHCLKSIAQLPRGASGSRPSTMVLRLL